MDLGLTCRCIDRAVRASIAPAMLRSSSSLSRAIAALPFHHPVRRFVARVRWGPDYLTLRDRCAGVEPTDPVRRVTAHVKALGSVQDVKALNSEDPAIQDAPLVGPDAVAGSTISGVVVSVGRPYRDRIAPSDLVWNGRVHHHVLVFTGAAFVEFYVRDGMEPRNVHLDYNISKVNVLPVVLDEPEQS
jgi:hypothetical protein